jgi:SWI/SNF-related matrix-associated actin-dependent regulator 1 of chromatin subfamily A
MTSPSSPVVVRKRLRRLADVLASPLPSSPHAARPLASPGAQSSSASSDASIDLTPALRAYAHLGREHWPEALTAEERSLLKEERRNLKALERIADRERLAELALRERSDLETVQAWQEEQAQLRNLEDSCQLDFVLLSGTRVGLCANPADHPAVAHTLCELPDSATHDDAARKESGCSHSMSLSAYHVCLAVCKRLLTEQRVALLVRPLSPDTMRLLSSPHTAAPVDEAALGKRIPAALLEQMFPFQREGVAFGVRCGGRLLLGDDMGLGKCIQAIALAAYYAAEDWPLLIVCPSSMRLTWKNELLKWLGPSAGSKKRRRLTEANDAGEVSSTPETAAACAAVLEDNDRDIQALLDGTTVLRPDAKVTILSYDLLSKYRAALPATHNFQMIICDESHYLKHRDAQRTQHMLELTRRVRRVALLSGTPVTNRPFELFSQLHMVAPALFPSAAAFGLRYCHPGWNRGKLEFTGGRLLAELAAVLRASIFLRRTKEQVLTQLPSKTRSLVYTRTGVTASASELDAVASGEAEGCAPATVMQAWKRNGEAKVPFVCSLLEDKLQGSGGHEKFLVFAHHLSVLESLRQYVAANHIGHIFLDGSTPGEKRQGLVDRFQSDPECLVAILSITAGGTGLTLTAADCVIFAELVWDPALLRQAEDRAHRIGQGRHVQCFYPLAEDSIDMRMWERLQSKLALTAQVL